MAGISSVTTINRDNIVGLVQASSFFEQNPALQSHAEALQACRKNAAEARRKSTCGCSGAGRKLFTPCIEAILTQLENEKATNQKAIEDFVRYTTHQPVGSQRVKVTVYYTKNNGATPHRYEFVA